MFTTRPQVITILLLAIETLSVSGGPVMTPVAMAPPPQLTPASDDFFKYRHVVAVGIKDALDECRDLFKWEPWNCPQNMFIDVLRRKQLPANKELGLVRAFTAASIVLSMTRDCDTGKGASCECANNNINENLIQSSSNDEGWSGTDVIRITNKTDEEHVSSQFAWQGCEASAQIALSVAKKFLEENDVDPANRLISEHNYGAGRLAIKRNSKRVCKCHGTSGSCQYKTCWIGLPSLRQVGDYLRRHHRTAIKVGASSALESDASELAKELTKTKPTKLVFVDPSPDYCYPLPQFGINGTLGRQCVPNHKKVSSCDRLCTKCGYRIIRETIQVEGQCDCRFKYCCSVECKRCMKSKEIYRCAKHGH